MRLSVVLPVLNEAPRLGRRLAELRAMSGVDEIVVADGGSDDGSLDIARATAGVRVVSAPRGRGTQMNAGARAARGDVLLFLHADTSLPRDAAAWVERTLVEPGVVAGAFRIRTVADDGPNWLGPLLRLADLRSRWSGLPYGDQGVFVRRAAFVLAGGFPDQPLMEDIELARRLRRLGRIETVPAVAEVSARRFLARPVRTVLALRTFPVLYRLGVTPARLARLYGDPR